MRQGTLPICFNHAASGQEERVSPNRQLEIVAWMTKQWYAKSSYVKNNIVKLANTGTELH